MPIYYEANLDGTIELAEPFIKFDPIPLIIDALNNGEWNFEVLEQSGKSFLKGKLYNESLNIEKEITFTIGKIQNQEEGRNKKEKRIQVSPTDTEIGFNFKENSNSLYVILGVYKRKEYEDTVFCMWPRDAIKNPNTQITLRIKIDLISKALVNGFAKSYNQANQLLVAFKPEFIHKEIVNNDINPVLIKPTYDKQDLDKKVDQIFRKKYKVKSAPGNKIPRKKFAQIEQYERDIKVKCFVLDVADGVCESCKSNAPFINEAGRPYLEVHHIKRLADGGSDTVSNAIAVCPNCHMELHYSKNAQHIADELINSIDRLIKE